MDKKLDPFEQSIDDLVAEISDALPLQTHKASSENMNQNIILTGVARIGKSLLAKKLASALGYAVINTDKLRNVFWHIADNDLRARVRQRTYTKLLRFVPCGLLIEGDNLLFNHQENCSVSLDLSLVARIRDGGLAKCFLVGCSGETWQRKLQEIDRYRKEHDCWTSDETAESRERLAKEIVENSLRLRLAGKQSFTYIELKSDSFADSVSRGLEQITEGLLETDCKNARLHHFLGNLLQKQGRLEKAATAQRLAIKLEPRLAAAHRQLSSVYVKQNRPEEALFSARRAVECEPGRADFHSHLGSLLQTKSRLEEAEAEQRLAIKLDPFYVDAYRRLSSVLARQHRQDEALTIAQKAVALDPDDAKLHRHLGNLLQRQGFSEQADVALRRAARLASAAPEALADEGPIAKGSHE
jgi:tetratricopeptide (TPR) repeat protein